MAGNLPLCFLPITMKHGTRDFWGKGRGSLDNPETIRLRLENEWLLLTRNLSWSLSSWKQVNTLLTGPYSVERGTAHLHNTQDTVQKSATLVSVVPTVAQSSSTCFVWPCHRQHPSHLSPCKLSCQKATGFAYACLPDHILSGESHLQRSSHSTQLKS